MIGYKNDNKFLFVLFFFWLLCAVHQSHGITLFSALSTVRRPSRFHALHVECVLLLFVCRCCWCLAFCSLYLRLKIFQAFWVLFTEWSEDLRRPGKKPTQFFPSILLNYFVIFLSRHFKSNVFCDLNIYLFFFVSVTHGTMAICMDSEMSLSFFHFEAAFFLWIFK